MHYTIHKVILKKGKKEGWVNSKGKMGREGENPALKNPIKLLFFRNLLIKTS